MSESPTNSEPYVAQTVFGRLAALVLNRRLAASLVVLGIIAASILLIKTRLGLNSNLLSLLPQEEPVVQSIQDFQDRGAKLERMTLSVDGDDEVVDAFFAEVDEELSKTGMVEHSFYELEPDLALRLGALKPSLKQLKRIRGNIQAALALGRGAALLQGMVFSAGSAADDLGTGSLQDGDTAQSLFKTAGLVAC